MSTSCIFCKIIAEEIPSQKVYEDEWGLVFHDIHPKSKVHLLIVPKKHIPTIMDLEIGDETIVGHLHRIAQEVGKNLGLEGYKLQINVGEKGGQEVFHLHVHLLG